MPTDANHIEPALSAEEWATVGALRISGVGPLPNGDFVAGDVALIMTKSTAAQHAIMALANAALPDDSPHKITRADVGLLRTAALLVGDVPAYDADCNPSGSGVVYLLTQQARLDALAAKLAALLPPNG